MDTQTFDSFHLKYPLVRLRADEQLERYCRLERETNTSFDRVNFADKAVLQAVQSGDTDGVAALAHPFVRQLIDTLKPATFEDVVRLMGVSHMPDADTAIRAYQTGRVYREDVFRLLREHFMLLDNVKDGSVTFAMTFVRYIGRGGVHRNRKIPSPWDMYFEELNIPSYVTELLLAVPYWFPKTIGVESARTALTLMWYKQHYPAVFARVFAQK